MIPEPTTLDGLRCLLDSIEGDPDITETDAAAFVFVMHPSDWEEVAKDPSCQTPSEVSKIPERALGVFGGHWIFVLSCWEPGQLCMLPYEGLVEVIDLESKSWEASN